MLRVHLISCLYLSIAVVFVEYQIDWLISNFLQLPVVFCLPGTRFCYASVQLHARTTGTTWFIKGTVEGCVGWITVRYFPQYGDTGRSCAGLFRLATAYSTVRDGNQQHFTCTHIDCVSHSYRTVGNTSLAWNFRKMNHRACSVRHTRERNLDLMFRALYMALRKHKRTYTKWTGRKFIVRLTPLWRKAGEYCVWEKELLKRKYSAEGWEESR